MTGRTNPWSFSRGKINLGRCADETLVDQIHSSGMRVETPYEFEHLRDAACTRKHKCLAQKVG